MRQWRKQQWSHHRTVSSVGRQRQVLADTFQRKRRSPDVNVRVLDSPSQIACVAYGRLMRHHLDTVCTSMNVRYTRHTLINVLASWFPTPQVPRPPQLAFPWKGVHLHDQVASRRKQLETITCPDDCEEPKADSPHPG